jgi:thymidylate synthase
MELSYLSLLKDVLENGEIKTDRTGVGTKSVFGRQIRCSLSDGFPLLTTKYVPFKSVAAELLWFLEGSSDERRLCEILHGTRDSSKNTIWTANAKNTTSAKYSPKFEGDLGRIYGVQWRDWKSHTFIDGVKVQMNDDTENKRYWSAIVDVRKHDQIANIINTLKTNPNDRRMVLTAFNVGELDEMMLPPCHMFSQFYVSGFSKSLSCQVYIRSNDLFLGLPFNIASYALLTHMMAQVTGYNVGDLIITIGDAHIYLNHIEQVKLQLSREPKSLPTLSINPLVENIDSFSLKDFQLVNYEHFPAIPAVMAV